MFLCSGLLWSEAEIEVGMHVSKTQNIVAIVPPLPALPPSPLLLSKIISCVVFTGFDMKFEDRDGDVNR